jgi:addiction module RelB/DinJ family antitoxin
MTYTAKKSQIIQVRVDPALRTKIDGILEELGMTTTQAINIFFKQIERRKGIPFPMTLDQLPMVNLDEERSIITSRNQIKRGDYIIVDPTKESELNKALGI